MNTENINRCPKCQAEVKADSPQGLCPKCLLEAVSTPTEGRPADEPHAIPSLETVATAFPQLEILSFIGQGGMGLVYKARQVKLDRLVALKLLPLSPGADPAFGERFNREARVLARLNHPNIVAVHDFGQAANFCYLLMEFVDGVNLRQAMRAGRFSPAQALALVPKICDALQYAHEEGVLHRDIKPENLLLDARGRVKIADFGIAKLQGSNDITLTASGAAMGTPHYMAPEQLEHPHDVDQRADIYSLGVVFYEMLTGELPLGRFAPPSGKANVDARVDEIVMRTLEKERELRFQSAGEVKTRVEQVASNPAPAEGAPKADSTEKAQVHPSSDADPAAPSPKGRGGRFYPWGRVIFGWEPPDPEMQISRKAWSKRAVAAAALVSLSLFEMALVLLSHARPDFGEILLLILLIGVPGLLGIGLGRRALEELQSAREPLRGGRLALIAVAAWPLFLVNICLFACLISLTHGVFRFFGPALGVLGSIGIVFLDGFALWHLFQNQPSNKFQNAALVLLQRSKRIPHKVILGVGVMSLLVFFLMTRREHRIASELARREAEVSWAAQKSIPTPPPGYFVPELNLMHQDGSESPGSIPLPPGYDAEKNPGLWGNTPQPNTAKESTRLFHTSLIVPSGYALTIHALLFSNQTELAQSKTTSTAFVIAPGDKPVEGVLSWRLLGGAILADGAPLEFSLQIKNQASQTRKTFHLTPPEPLTIDWAGEPAAIWPPRNGRTKFIILKGLSNDPQADPQSSTEWMIGIATRLDPVSDSIANGNTQGFVGLGTNWRAAAEEKPKTSPELADPPVEPTLNVP